MKDRSGLWTLKLVHEGGFDFFENKQNFIWPSFYAVKHTSKPLVMVQVEKILYRFEVQWTVHSTVNCDKMFPSIMRKFYPGSFLCVCVMQKMTGRDKEETKYFLFICLFVAEQCFTQAACIHLHD